MYINNRKIILVLAVICLSIMSCKVPALKTKEPNIPLPNNYSNSSANIEAENWANIPWQKFFKDSYLQNLIDTALHNNKELQITLQEIEIAQNDVAFRKSFLYPKVGLKVGAGLEKVARYTSQGAGDASTEIEHGKEMPDPLADFGVSAVANWEVDIWHKLHNAQDAAVKRYLSSVEGKNFVLSNLIGEIASSYYELVTLDNQLAVIHSNIALQEQALEIVKVNRQIGRVNELAVQKFTADLLKTQATQFKYQQQIVEIENRINFLMGRYPQKIDRHVDALLADLPEHVMVGIPSQMLHNRPDIKQAELELQAANLDVKVARAEFYPSLDISAALGLQAFKPSYLIKVPESMLFSLAGDLFAPLINRGAIKAEFKTASAQQLQSLYNYEQVVLNAYLEVSNQMSNITNLEKEVSLQTKQVNILNSSIGISKDLFASNKAEYLEILDTQREALEGKLELLEMKKMQFDAMIKVYKGLGGGWK